MSRGMATGNDDTLWSDFFAARTSNNSDDNNNNDGRSTPAVSSAILDSMIVLSSSSLTFLNLLEELGSDVEAIQDGISKHQSQELLKGLVLERHMDSILLFTPSPFRLHLTTTHWPEFFTFIFQKLTDQAFSSVRVQSCGACSNELIVEQPTNVISPIHVIMGEEAILSQGCVVCACTCYLELHRSNIGSTNSVSVLIPSVQNFLRLIIGGGGCGSGGACLSRRIDSNVLASKMTGNTLTKFIEQAYAAVEEVLSLSAGSGSGPVAMTAERLPTRPAHLLTSFVVNDEVERLRLLLQTSGYWIHALTASVVARLLGQPRRVLADGHRWHRKRARHSHDDHLELKSMVLLMFVYDEHSPSRSLPQLLSLAPMLKQHLLALCRTITQHHQYPHPTSAQPDSEDPWKVFVPFRIPRETVDLDVSLWQTLLLRFSVSMVCLMGLRHKFSTTAMVAAVGETKGRVNNGDGDSGGSGGSGVCGGSSSSGDRGGNRSSGDRSRCPTSCAVEAEMKQEGEAEEEKDAMAGSAAAAAAAAAAGVAVFATAAGETVGLTASSVAPPPAQATAERAQGGAGGGGETKVGELTSVGTLALLDAFFRACCHLLTPLDLTSLPSSADTGSAAKSTLGPESDANHQEPLKGSHQDQLGSETRLGPHEHPRARGREEKRRREKLRQPQKSVRGQARALAALAALIGEAEICSAPESAYDACIARNERELGLGVGLNGEITAVPADGEQLRAWCPVQQAELQRQREYRAFVLELFGSLEAVETTKSPAMVGVVAAGAAAAPAAVAPAAGSEAGMTMITTAAAPATEPAAQAPAHVGSDAGMVISLAKAPVATADPAAASTEAGSGEEAVANATTFSTKEGDAEMVVSSSTEAIETTAIEAGSGGEPVETAPCPSADGSAAAFFSSAPASSSGSLLDPDDRVLCFWSLLEHLRRAVDTHHPTGSDGAVAGVGVGRGVGEHNLTPPLARLLQALGRLPAAMSSSSLPDESECRRQDNGSYHESEGGNGGASGGGAGGTSGSSGSGSGGDVGSSVNTVVPQWPSALAAFRLRFGLSRTPSPP